MIEILLEEPYISNGFTDIPDYLPEEGPDYCILYLLGAIEKKALTELIKKGFPKKSLELTFFTHTGNNFDGKYEGHIKIYQINPYGNSSYYDFNDSKLWKNKEGLIRLSANKEYYIPVIGEEQLSYAFVDESFMEKIDEFYDAYISADESLYLDSILRELTKKFMITNEFQELEKRIRKELSIEVIPLGYEKPEKLQTTMLDKVLHYSIISLLGFSGLFFLSKYLIDCLCE